MEWFDQLLAWFRYPPNAPLAGWVQAVGALVAIGIAIAVPWQQRRNDVEREKARHEQEINSILYSIRSEIDEFYHWTLNWTKIEDKVNGITPKKPFLTKLLVPERSFFVYEACVARIGTIEDRSLRGAIISYYQRAMSLISAIKLNNEFIDQYNESKSMYEAFGDPAQLQLQMKAEEGLIYCEEQLRDRLRDVRGSTQYIQSILPIK